MPPRPPESTPPRPHPTPPTARAWQSVLEPHIEPIWALRRAGKTYRQIAAEMGTLGVSVNASTVCRFVQARKRRILATRLPDLPPRPSEKTQPETVPVLAEEAPKKAESLAGKQAPKPEPESDEKNRPEAPKPPLPVQYAPAKPDEL